MWEAEDLPKHVERARRLGYEEVRYNDDHDHDDGDTMRYSDDHDHDDDDGDCNYDGVRRIYLQRIYL